MNGLEAVADAIMQFEGWYVTLKGVPSMSYRNRNPGNLESNGEKLIFEDFISGYSALLRELRAKFTGNNHHRIGPDSTLLDLFNVYAPPSDSNPTPIYCGFVAHWVTMATGRQTNSQTRLRDIWTSPLNQGPVDLREVTVP